jgi:methyl-accepting chemotaxis protein/methyl-accepting chemotaxis protein-2 (aspartate sensor receptor)
MKNLTLSAKITLGFALMLLIMLLIGSIAIISMAGVAGDSEKLAGIYVPETKVGNAVERNALLTRFEVRGYVLKRDKKYLATGREYLAKVKQHLDEAKALAQKYSLPALTRLEAQARANVATYEAMVDKNEMLYDELGRAKEAMDRSAALYMKNSHHYLSSQHDAIKREIKRGVSKGKLNERYNKIRWINEIITLGNETRINNLKFQENGNQSFIKSAMANFPKIERILREIRKLTKKHTTREELKAIEKGAATYKGAIETYLAAWNQMQQLHKERKKAGSAVLAAAKETAEVAMEHTQQIADDAASNLDGASMTVIIGLVIAIIISIIAAILIIRSITLPIITAIQTIRDANTQVMDASDQIAASASNLADGASKQASSVEEVSATVEESTTINTQNADNAVQASRLATGANDAAQDGNVKIQGLMGSMNDITEASEKIAKIIKTIDEIAFQTNLLALNAAVEAARAGEHGLGFAVVADEVKNLAQRSADAAKETTTIIQQAIDQIKNGNQIAHATNDSFSNILDQAKKSSDIINEITGSIKEQAEGMNQIASAMGEVDEVTQQNAAASEEAAAASEEMNAQVVAMMESVEEVARMIGLSTETAEETETTRPLLEHKKL